LFTGIDFFIFSVYRKSKPRGSANFRLGSNPNQKARNPMIQADSVLSTPPINMSAIALHLRLKAAGMRLERVSNDSYRILWRRHQLVVSDLTLLQAAMFIDRALVRR
jgi:hypothetical protein